MAPRDVSLEAAVLLYGVLGAFSVERAYCINSINNFAMRSHGEAAGPRLCMQMGMRVR